MAAQHALSAIGVGSDERTETAELGERGRFHLATAEAQDGLDELEKAAALSRPDILTAITDQHKVMLRFSCCKRRRSPTVRSSPNQRNPYFL